MADGTIAHRDFFISRAGINAEFAIWLGKLIKAQGKSYVLQDEHFGHQNFMGAMDRALKSGARVVGLLSQAYLESDHCLAEAAAALDRDPLNKQQRLILLRLEPCAPGGVLVNVAFTDLLAERRQVDARPLALKVLRALGLDNPKLDGLPPPPEGTLSKSIQILHAEVQAVPGFTGREGELAALEQALWANGGTAAVTDIAAAANSGAVAAAVKGLGGVGKSVLAKEYAWRNRARYQGVWWVRAEKRETLLDDLIELGARFIPDLEEVPERETAARAAIDYLEQAGFQKPWLMVYDNVEEPGAIDKLTPRTGAQVLITTRFPEWGRIAAPVKVGVFPPDVAARFLLDATGRSDRAGAEKLAAALGYLPLALDHAAAYCKRTGTDFADYQKLTADLLRKAPKGAAYATPVFATFSLAIDKAAQACPEAEKLMGVCAFLAPDRIPLGIFTGEVLTEIQRGEAVAALGEVSLVTLETLDDGSPGLSVHRLVQEVMRGRLRASPSPLVGEGRGGGDCRTSAVGIPPTPNPSPQGGGEAFAANAALATRLLADAYPGGEVGPDDVRSWPACRRLESHAIAVLAVAPDEGEVADKTALLLNQYALHLKARADFAAAEPLYRRALAIDEKSFGLEHPNVAIRLNNLASLLQATNRLAEAEPLMRRALAIDEMSLGPEHPNVAIRLNNLASLLQATNRLTEAEPLMRRVVAIFEKVERNAGHMHPNYAGSLNNLAQLLKVTNRLGEAEPLMRRALAIDETSFGPEHPNVARDLNNLALLLEATNRLGEAEPLMRRSVDIKLRSLGPDHPSTKLGVNNLAALEAELRENGAPAAARPDGAARAPPPREIARQPAKRGLLGRWFGGG